MPKYFRNKNTKYVKDFNLVGDFDAISDSENMYIDYAEGGFWLESFPGFRKLKETGKNINGIFDMGLGENGFLVHAGTNLHLYRYFDIYKDVLWSKILLSPKDHKSFCYKVDNNVVFFDGTDIGVIYEDLTGKMTVQDTNLIYVPTTYVNGEEAEQVNLLTDKFCEEYNGITVDDFAYESKGLKYRIKSESERTCAVIGAEDGAYERLEIPNRKRINGRYYKVTEIADGAFENDERITEVILGRRVSRVGKRAFFGCTSLRLAVMPDGIIDIDEEAFANCSTLQSVYIGVTCKSIYYNSFMDCNSSMKVYFSDVYERLEKCEGVGNLMVYAVIYSTKYPLKKLAVPVYSPAAVINKLTVEGVETSFISELDRGFITVNTDDIEGLEGKSILISGKLDKTKIRISERGTTFSAFTEGGTDTKALIISATDGEGFDGRGFVFGAPEYENIVFASSFTREGKAHPLYFGDLDYFPVGSALHPISDVKKEGGRLAVSKNSEDGGSIFILQPKGEERAMFGRRYPLVYQLKDTGIRSKLYEFDKSTIFVGRNDICKMKYSSASAVYEPITLKCPEAMRKDINGDMIFSTIGGYLAVISGTNMYLGDNRLTTKVRGMEQYKWFPIRNVGGYEGDFRNYYYARSEISGIYSHPDLGKATDETVMSYVDENGDTIYYVTIGIRKYRVTPGEEVFGGVVNGIAYADKYDDTIIFGTEKGDLYAFNTDKKAILPSFLHDNDKVDLKKTTKLLTHKIHPSFYTGVGHRIRYSVTTAPYNGELAHIMKSNIRGALTAKLDSRSSAKICFATSSDRKEPESLGGVVMGDCYFWEMSFGDFSFANDSPEIVAIRENREKWVEKQITVYTDQLKAPFAVNLISLGFKVDGKIINGQDR